MALQRRLPEDDQWCVPHNLYLAVYSPSSVNVLCFDPSHGADQARGAFLFVYILRSQTPEKPGYAGKYCSKPERYFFLEGEKNGVKAWSPFLFELPKNHRSCQMKQRHNKTI